MATLLARVPYVRAITVVVTGVRAAAAAAVVARVAAVTDAVGTIAQGRGLVLGAAIVLLTGTVHVA